jgi:hypothetical protein
MRTKTIAAVALSALLLGPAAFAQTTQTPNSGAGQPGLPGNKSGPAVKPERNGTPPDTSGVKGLPGNKSGPAVQPPKNGQTK